MTTAVSIKSPRPNHMALHVALVAISVGEDPEMKRTVNELGSAAPLVDGQSTSQWVSGSQGILITELPKDQVPPAAPRELSLAEKMAGVGFNPSSDPAVDNCKDGYAERIAEMVLLRERSSDPEVKRMASIAITNLQTAQMFAVKAITWRG